MKLFTYRTILSIRKLFFQLGIRRRYVFFGPCLDKRITQRLFKSLCIDNQRMLVSNAKKKDKYSQSLPVPVFMHIPKTAGSSIGELLENKVSRTDFYTTIERPEDGYDNERFKLAVNNPDIKIIQGHFDSRLLEIIERPYFAFTFLRDPVDHVVSFYYYIKNHPKHSQFSLIQERDMNLSEIYRTTPPPLLDNLQVRYLCGKPSTKLSEEDLEQAKTNLRSKFELVGTLDNLDAAIVRLSRLLNLSKQATIQHINVGKHRPHFEEVPKATRDAIEEHNSFSRELYEYAKSL
ncbi:hypothetical protein TH47_14610 [Thalassospira sp. MCCC 1A02803]|nr:hypothetical protein AUQ41_15090 [Thalassospira sp. MCCC 1A02898]ONH86825.1 hypothetical protein TH47_14610 [Thalassospira sp. MCCC 1A02803]